MRERCSDNQTGFTLLELMFCVVFALVILASIFQMLESNRSTYASGETRMNVQQNARVGMDEISRELRMTGYYPENFDTNAGNDLANVNAIQLATNNALAILGDADGSGTSNVFLFCLDGDVLRRKRAVSGVLATYTCSGGDALAEDVTSLRFGYFNGTNAAIPAVPTPPFQLDGQALDAVPSFANVTQRQAVRRVVVTLTVRKDVPQQSPQIYTLTSDVRLRNLN